MSGQLPDSRGTAETSVRYGLDGCSSRSNRPTLVVTGQRNARRFIPGWPFYFSAWLGRCARFHWNKSLRRRLSFAWAHEAITEDCIMSQDHDEREAALSRRHALAWVMGAGTAALYALSAGKGRRLGLFDRADAASATAQTTPMIPVIVKDTTSLYWQTVLAGARKAGQELGAQSESDVAGQINILESAVAANPAAVVIAPAQFAALGRPIDAAAKKVRIIGIQSAADTAAFTSMLTTDNVQAGRIAADILAERIQKTYADAEGDVALITSSFGVAEFEQRAKGFKEQIATKYGALNVVAEKVADGEATTARKLMSDLIAAYTELRGVVRSNPMMAQ